MAHRYSRLYLPSNISTCAVASPDIIQLLEGFSQLARRAFHHVFLFLLAIHLNFSFSHQLACLLLVSYVASPVFANLLLRRVINRACRIAG